jgi:glycosyltransferase involved in cell wall biosynthesis
MDKNIIRVLFLDTVMDRGGAEAMTMNYFRNIDRTKVVFDFLVHRDYKAAYEDEIESLGGRIYRICPPYPQNYFKYRNEFGKFLLTHPEYKIIHCNMMERGLFAYMEAKKRNIPVRICHAHTAPGKIIPKNIRYFVISFYKAMALRYITHKFACGKKAAEWVFGNRNIKDVIYMKNAVDAESFRYNQKLDIDVRKEFNIIGKFVVGHVGRFFEPKNHPFIVDIFAEVAKREPSSILMLIGGGELDNAIFNKTKEKVKRLGLEDRVIFTGVRNDVDRLIQAFNVFILPSIEEGFPVVLVEAQAAGLKCVVSDSVTKECDITGNIKFLPLEIGASKWAEIIIQNKGSQKKDMYETIVKSGYDIKENAKWLQDFYFNSIQ